MNWRRLLLPLALVAIPQTGLPAEIATGEIGESIPIDEQGQARRVMVMLNLGADHYRAGNGYGGGYIDVMGQKIRLRAAKRIAREHKLELLKNWPMDMIGVDCVIMEIHDLRSVDAVVAELTQEPGVAWSQPLNEFQVQSAPRGTYNDRLYRAQPAASRWNLAGLHKVATGRGIQIGVIDSRVDTAHPDLAGQVTAAPDFVDGKSRAAEKHGTGVAGIIAARPNNGIGIAGVAPGARVVALRACWEKQAGGATVCDSLSLAKALVYAIERKIDVINLSLTGPADRLISTLVTQALKRGLTVVAAVDDQYPEASFPASVAGVIPVADEHLSSRKVNVYIAPGQDVVTTEPEGKWSLVSGSSFAAAHVSGLAALLKQLGKNRGRPPSTSAALGARGPVDACAAVARVSPADAGSCR